METINDNISIEIIDLNNGSPILDNTCKFIRLELLYALNTLPSAVLHLSAPDSLRFALLNDLQIRVLLTDRFKLNMTFGIIQREVINGAIILHGHMLRRSEINNPGSAYLGSDLLSAISALNLIQKPDKYFRESVKVVGDFWRFNETVESVLQKLLYGAKNRTPWLMTEDDIRLVEFNSSEILDTTPADHSSSFIFVDGKESIRVTGSRISFYETFTFDSTNLSFNSNSSYYKNLLSNLLFNDPMYLSIVQNYNDYIPYQPGDRIRAKIQTMNKVMNIIAKEIVITNGIQTKFNLGVLKDAT